MGSVYATEKRSCLLRLRHRIFVRGSSGIAPFATVLGVKNADCHTPPAVLVRGGSTISIGWEWLAVPPLVHRHCGRSVAPLPSSLQVYYTTKGTICQYLFQIFFDRLRRDTSKYPYEKRRLPALSLTSHNRIL